MKRFVYAIILIIVILFLGLYILINNKTKPEDISYSYSNCIVYKDNNIIESNLNLVLNGSINKKVIIGVKSNVFKTIDGNVEINDEDYIINLAITEEDVYLGRAFKSINSGTEFTILLTSDFEEIYLMNEKENYEIISASDIAEFKSIKNNFLN